MNTQNNYVLRCACDNSSFDTVFCVHYYNLITAAMLGGGLIMNRQTAPVMARRILMRLEIRVHQSAVS
jgi:hypothetical protein